MKIKAMFVGALAAAALTLVGGVANASVIVMDFAGLNGNAEELVQEFYNGGTGSLGSTGPNYGVSFTGTALSCSGQPGGTCNSAQIPGGPGANLMFYLDGVAIMNVANGFSNGFAFGYSAVNQPATVNIWSGVDASGDLLATLNLAMTPNGAGDPACSGAGFCPYTAIGVSFAGIAKSVDFGGSTNQVAFGDVTLGSTTMGGPAVSAAPEPSTWALMLLAIGGLGVVLRAQRRADQELDALRAAA
jgi:hypothetical protein